MRFAPLTLLLCISAAAQSSGGTGSIEGTVVDSVTQAPVWKAQVRLVPRMMTAPPPRQGPPPMPPRPPVVISDAAGSFRVSNLPAGRYGIAAHHVRYPTRPGMEEKEVEVKDGEAARITVSLAPGATVNGRILDEEGDPIQGCMVRLQTSGTEMVGMPGMGMEQSNEQGEYRLWGISAGKYFLAAQCGRSVFQPRPFSSGPPAPPSLAYPIQFYPDAAEISAAQAIELRSGMDRTGVDFRMKPSRVYTVTGLITAPAERTLQHAMVELMRKGDTSGFQRRGGRVNPATGEFQIYSVFPGTYDLVAGVRTPNQMEPALGVRQTIDVSDRPLQVRIALQNPVDLTGSVALESDTAYQVSQTSLQLIPEEGAQMLAAPPPAQVASDGSFVVKGVLPGRWRVVIHAPNAFLKSMELGGRAIEGTSLDVPAGSAGPLRVVVSTRTASLEGTGTPGRQYLVVEDSADSRFGARHHAIADLQGRIRLPALAPGKYRIYEGYPGANNTVVQEFTAVEGGSVTVEFKQR